MNTALPISLVVLISGNGSNLQAIINQIESGRLNARIAAVISNRPDAFGLERARKHHIPAIGLDHKSYQKRTEFDQALQEAIEKYEPDIIILAGYMRILSAEFIIHFAPRLLNIHPSLLPKYPGLNTYQRSLENGDRKHGVSIHIVTADLDSGPVILQGEFEITREDDIHSMQQKTHELEYQMYPLVIQWLSEKRLQLMLDGALFDNEKLQKPLLFNTL